MPGFSVFVRCIFYVVDIVSIRYKMNDFDFSPSFFFSRAVDYDEEEDEAMKDVDRCVFCC